jgi:2-dehydro-3-deoxy-D-arabinonate dehydratase
MQLCKVQLSSGSVRTGVLEAERVRLLSGNLSEILHSTRPVEAAQARLEQSRESVPIGEARLLAPIDQQEVWAAGVTYKRSEEARKRESVGAARFYDLVYTAARPELFFKAPASRVIGPGQSVHVRRDSRWSVPEPELALVLSPSLQLVGFTIGNDMSARDIEGENPLYLPQAKVYDGACAIGPVVTLAEAMPSAEETQIRLTIQRAGQPVFEGSTTVAAMARPFADLITWLGKETSFPHGAILLTGTGIVPPDNFTLHAGDSVTIGITGIGELSNPVTTR